MSARKVIQQEEDATELRFGTVFNNAHCLLLSEVRVLLEGRLEESKKLESQGFEQSLPEAFTKTLSYAQKFSSFQNGEAIMEIRKSLLEDKKLHEFEVASLANLCPETVEEAKSLIPSLMGRYENDDDLQELLDVIKNYKDFQT
eukprot:Opistho-2@9055